MVIGNDKLDGDIKTYFKVSDFFVHIGDGRKSLG